DSAKTLAGMAMAAARLNLPAIIVTTGGSRWVFRQNPDGDQKRTMPDPYELLSQTLFGASKKKGVEPCASSDLFNECLLGQDNHASHALDLALEALGVTLPGMTTAPVQSPRRNQLAEESGERVVALIKSGHGFRRFLTPNAFANAVRLNAALGGSIDVVVHLTALAHEAGAGFGLEIFDRIARETPQVCRLGGVGEKAPHTLEDLDRAGGVWAVMHALKEKVLPTATLTGKGALELAKTTPVKDTSVIQANRPYAKQSGIGVLTGNLAPKGALFLLNQVAPVAPVFRGPVAVFENEIDAARALCDGTVKKGSALVVRGQGPRGGPGLRKLRVLPALMASRGWWKNVPLITDGRLPDTPAGLFIGLVSPEAVTSGPLAVIRTGDQIEIDVAARRLGVRLTDMELRIRMSRWQAPDLKTRRGFLERYSRQVSEAHEGAVLK
ncbi:MAG: dihydroxy-acid dehydratase, partial [Elusimicrobia bacterium]|nr:dihydroxy-acid dehydratase [Elusimicrobiota bacterium]